MKEAKKLKAGRKTVMTKSVIGKLEQAFLIGCSDKEACMYANISPDTLYSYQKNNPLFSERKKSLKTNPFLKARMTVFNALDQPKMAKWFLERRRKDEFGLRPRANISKSDPALEEKHLEAVERILKDNDVLENDLQSGR